MQSKFAPSERPGQQSRYSIITESYTRPQRGVFRQPRQQYEVYHKAANSLCKVSDFDSPINPLTDAVAARKNAKLYSPNNMYDRKPPVTKMIQRMLLIHDTLRSNQIQQARQRKLRHRRVRDYINLSDITIDGEIPSDGILVEKIMNSGLVNEKPSKANQKKHKDCPDGKKRVKRVTRGIQCNGIRTIEAEVQHDIIMADSQAQYDQTIASMSQKHLGTQTIRQPDIKKLTKEEILDLLRATYTTVDVGIGVNYKSHHVSHAKVPPARSAVKQSSHLPPPPPAQKESSRFKLSKSKQPSLKTTSVRDMYNKKLMKLRLCGSKIPTKDIFQDAIDHSDPRSDSAASLTPSSDPQDDDPCVFNFKFCCHTNVALENHQQ